jgi:hypothetical protein
MDRAPLAPVEIHEDHLPNDHQRRCELHRRDRHDRRDLACEPHYDHRDVMGDHRDVMGVKMTMGGC